MAQLENIIWLEEIFFQITLRAEKDRGVGIRDVKAIHAFFLNGNGEFE